MTQDHVPASDTSQERVDENEKQRHEIEIDSYEPDYNHRCEVCGVNHVVTGVKDGKVVYQGDMCGVCTWGESAMIDPAEWNKEQL